MKKVNFLVGIALVSLLAGCSKQPAQSKQKTQKSSQSSKVVKKATQKSASKQKTGSSQSSAASEKTSWDETKKQQLKTYMVTFSQTMNQSYQDYQPGTNTDFYGLKYPDDLAKNNVAVNDQHVTASWSNDGQGQDDYQVVAVYSDAASSNYGGQHLYLFTLHDQQPVILITEQNQGMPDQMIHFKETANADLKNHFAEIIAGQKATETPAATTKNIIPTDLQGTWYGYSESSKNSDKIDALKITTNQMTTASQVIDIHDVSERTSQDQAILDGRVQPTENSEFAMKQRWAIGGTVTQEGRDWYDVKGWYQSAGDGTYYSVKSRNVQGQTVPVLTEANGAGIWASTHYYQSKQMALANQETKYSDEHTQD